MDSKTLKSQLDTIDRRIGDVRLKIESDRKASQQVQQNLQYDINDAQKNLSVEETEPGQHQSWQSRITQLQAQLDNETQDIQRVISSHEQELSDLQSQRQSVNQQYLEALEREQAEAAARAAGTLL